MSKERRQNKRYELTLNLPIFDALQNAPLGHLADITTGGLLLQSESVVKLQREYFLEIRLQDVNAVLFYNDGEDKWVNFRAYSLWQVHDGSVYRTGFRIVDISPAATMSLSYLIRKFRRKEQMDKAVAT